MEPDPLLGAEGGKRLTNEDQRERLLHFQRKTQDGQNGSRDYNLSERQDRSGDQEEQTPENFTDLSISSKDKAIRCNSDGDQPRNFTRKMAGNDDIGEDSSRKYFDLTGNDSSFAMSAPTFVSEVKESQTRDCGSCFPKPLSSTVSETKSQVTASSTKVPKGGEVTTRCFQEEGMSPVETKVEEGNVQYQIPLERNASKRSQGFKENKCGSVEKPFSPLVSKEASVSRCDSEGDSDDEEYHDVLVLYDPKDKEHRDNFVTLCKKNQWTTMSREEFTIGEPHFEQLEEVIDNCTLVVPLITWNSLSQNDSKLEHHTGLYKTLTKKCNNFIPVVCEKGLDLPSFILALSPGYFYNESFERQLRKTMKKQRKKQEKLRNPPMNQLNSFDREKKQTKQVNVKDWSHVLCNVAINIPYTEF